MFSDGQERINTTLKVIRAAEILHVPIFITTQNRARLGDTCNELTAIMKPSNVKVDCDKTAFSMWTPSIASHFSSTTPSEVVIVGIESHICVTQTTLDLLANGHKVYVLADGVSSCNPQEVPIALNRLRAAGATVTTSESWIYECMGDASIPEYVANHLNCEVNGHDTNCHRFKAIAGLVKETSDVTKKTMSTLLSKM